VIVVGAAATLAVVVSACSSSNKNSADTQHTRAASSTPSKGSGQAAGSPSPSASPTPVTPQLRLSPANGTTTANPGGVASVTVTNGTLRGVTLLSSSGAHIKLAESTDGSSVKTAEELGYGRTYTWSGRAVGEEGSAVRVAGSFRTINPANIMHAHVNIGDGERVGIAAPIIIRFDGHVHNQAAVEKALSIRTSVPTVGSWGWLPDDADGSRVHWRPERYWKPGTRVSVTANLLGVDYGGGAYGEENITSRFAIGREQITKADINSHRLLVYRSGKLLFNFPASYGLQSDPNRNTHNGVHITMEKYPIKYMSNPAYGYSNIPERWAVRISNNGEFIHTNDSTDGVQGSSNVTHGCVNLNSTNGKLYYDSVLYGDPVIVTGSPIALSAADGDVYDWTVPWLKWKAMSALN
jgi:lipoprotein-anchoring transpeptidase ErfK/SrfK